MDDENNVNVNTSNDTTEEVGNTEEDEGTAADAGNEVLTKLQEQNKKLFERAKKAEADLKEVKQKLTPSTEAVKPKSEPELSQMDLYALMTAQVPQEDVQEVIKAAKILGKNVSEALKDDLVKTRLNQLKEIRTSAEVASSGKTKPARPKLTDEALIEKALKDIPEDEADIDSVTKARFALRKNK